MKNRITIALSVLSAFWSPVRAGGPDKYNIGITTSDNYVHTRTYTDASGTSAVDDVAYYDGLGYLSHTVQVGGSPDGRSLVQPVYYNPLFDDREREYLPYVAGTSGAASGSRLFSSSNYSVYGSSDSSFAFTLNEYEPSTLGRVLRSRKPGTAYSEADRHVTYDYGVNSASEVLRLTFASGAVSAGGYYESATLFRNSVTDEDGGRTVTYTDKHGNVVLERRNLTSTATADTYYVYDDSYRLVCVVPPSASSSLTSGSSSLPASTVNTLCYSYVYVGDRVVEKRLPGREVERYGYDLGGRMVLYQDGNMRSAGKAQLYRYDIFGRVVSTRIGSFTGVVDSSCYPDSALDNLVGQMGSVLVQYTYDTPDNTCFAAVSGIVSASDRDDNVHSLKTCERVGILGPDYTVTGYVDRWFYYDYRGRVIQTVSKYPDGSEHRVSTKYDFTGNVTSSRETYTHGSVTDTLDRSFDYDARGRLLTETATIGGVSSSVNYSYDSVGRLAGKSYGGTALTETLAYNIQGWQTSQTVKKGTETLFDNSLKYYDGSAPLYSGNISEWAWTQKGQTANTYKFSYDKMSRLLGADHYVGTTKVDKFTEKAITYDKNSNLTSMTRYVNGTAANISFAYSGNHRTGYTYDNNGNISKDPTNNLEISYNLFNLPAVIREGSTTKATYTYLADSCKYRTINSSGSGYDYIGSFKYNRNGSNIVLESVAGSGGRIYKTSGGYEVRYFISDHLGSTRLVANSAGTVLEQNDYMPYGERHSNSVLATSSNPYLYNGKESQKDFGINYIDSEARFQRLDGAFNSMDPKAEEFYWVSPYVYCNGNPIMFVDSDGKKVRAIHPRAQQMILNTLSSQERNAVSFDKNGYVQINSSQEFNSTNFSALKVLSMSNLTTNVLLNDCFTYLTPDMKLEKASMNYLGIDPDYISANIESISTPTTGEAGFLGKTLFPDLDGYQNSPTKDIMVIINSHLSDDGAAQMFSHEAYGHAYFYIITNGNHNKSSHNYGGGNKDLNTALLNQIYRAMSEALINIKQ